MSMKKLDDRRSGIDRTFAKRPVVSWVEIQKYIANKLRVRYEMVEWRTKTHLHTLANMSNKVCSLNDPRGFDSDFIGRPT
jgi:hypothetical protein